MPGIVGDKAQIFNKKKIILSVVLLATLGFLIQIFATEALNLALVPFATADEEYGELIGALVANPIMIFYVIVVAPIIEELIFRIFIVWLSLKFMPFWIANIIQAILFGIYHGNWIQGIYAFLLGMVLGYLMHDSKCLATSILLHISINASGVMQEKMGILTGEATSATNMIMGAVAFVLCCAVIFVLHKTWNVDEQS